MTASAVRLMPVATGTWVAPISESMKAVELVIAEIADTTIPILIMGESGTGKEVLARRIHGLSRQFEKPLAKISCASVTPDTLTEELTAHLQTANGRDETPGTILFDELSDLNTACQARLLHALPDGESNGNSTDAPRVISSTTRDLEDETHDGRFRSDLYYRINGICLRLPPLRERRDDIPVLVESLLAKHALQLGRPQPALGQDSLRALVDYSWPGNIRELENVVRTIVALGDERLAISELRSPPSSARKPAALPARSYSLKAAARAASREAERDLILQALTRTHWNRKRAARELQISYKSLLYKLKQIGIEGSSTN